MACRHYCLLQLRFSAVWLKRNDPEVGAERPRNSGGTTVFGVDMGRIDPGRIDPGRIDRKPDLGSVVISVTTADERAIA